ncbi:MAG TPA: cytochrome c3 family protein [Gemmatimonadales bacterium]|jgi:predicted CXXCH cytochrome family protein|nr:cytochrome c3 family protein [Gemmatimonadales bacterium]
MSARVWHLARVIGSAAVVAIGLAACSSDKIVYRDRAPFNPPPDSVNGFLGLFTVASNQTTCGNCHVGHQRDWATSAHSGAYATLVNSGHATSSCFGCHTVSERGNVATGPAGWNLVPDSAYHNVQCESCHGPGFNHVSEPDAPGNVPLAHLSVADSTASCASCHSGAHQPFVEEWSQSGHGGLVGPPQGRAECVGCHEGKAALKAWNASSHYAEVDDPTALPITCAVCHDPHGSSNSAQLRFPINSPSPDQNLCMRCHNRIVTPPGGTRNAPHAPQGSVLLGLGGYRPNGFVYDSSAIYTSHASDRNPRLCAGCHVNRYEVTDQLTGAFVFNSTGHLFQAIPCLDAGGKPVADNSCAYTPAARSFAACTNSGCHASADVAATALTNLRQRLATLRDQLWQDLNHNSTVDATDGGYLGTLKATRPAEFTADNTITAAEGAEFNVKMVGEGVYGNGDRSLGVHNPFLAEALMRANILELQSVYGLAAPAAPVERILESPMPGAGPQAAGTTRLISLR